MFKRSEGAFVEISRQLLCKLWSWQFLYLWQFRDISYFKQWVALFWNATVLRVGFGLENSQEISKCKNYQEILCKLLMNITYACYHNFPQFSFLYSCNFSLCRNFMIIFSPMDYPDGLTSYADQIYLNGSQLLITDSENKVVCSTKDYNTLSTASALACSQVAFDPTNVIFHKDLTQDILALDRSTNEVSIARGFFLSSVCLSSLLIQI